MTALLALYLFYSLISQALECDADYGKRERELIVESHGILTPDDVAYEWWYSEGTDYHERYTPSYWNCFEVKNFHFKCNDLHKLDTDHQQMVEENIYGIKKSRRHRFVYFRGVDVKTCEDDRQTFEKLTRENKHVCFAGSFGIDQIEQNSKGNKVPTTVWRFDWFKAKSDCLHYAAGSRDCEPNTYFKYWAELDLQKPKDSLKEFWSLISNPFLDKQKFENPNILSFLGK